jgi:site-specific DNA recombinase
MVERNPNAHTRLRGLLYARESESRRRTRTGKVLRGTTTSIPDQIKEGTGHADAAGIDILRVVTDKDRGASKYSPGRREQWEDEVIPQLESGNYDVLVTWECARGTRDLEVLVILRRIAREHGVKWFYNGRMHDLNDVTDSFIVGMDVLSAEREAGFTHERVGKGVRSRAAAGRPHGRLTYGYRRIYDAETGAYIKQVPDETTAPVVRDLFRTVAENGIGLCSLATKMNKSRIPTPRGSKAWRKESIRRILTNRAYLGDRMLNGEVIVSNAWEALVDEETWWSVQAACTYERTTTRPDNTVKYLLSGIARCGVCDSALVSANIKYATYYCNGRSCVGRSRKNLDAYITEIVLSILERQPAIGKRTTDPRIGEAQKTLTALRAQLQAFEDQAVADQLSAASFARIEKRLGPKITAAEDHVKALRARAGMPDLHGRPIREIWFLPEESGGLTLAEKRQIIRNTVQVRVMRTRRGGRTLDAADIDVTEIQHYA